jgi:hypothetical protein
MDERKIRARLEAERERLLSVQRDLRGDPRFCLEDQQRVEREAGLPGTTT